MRCAAAPVFLTYAVVEGDRHLVSSDGLFARRREVDTFLSSTWGDWVMIAQRDIGSPPSSPRRVTREHRGRPRHVSQGTLLCVSPQPLFKVEVDHDGAGDSHWVHSRPVYTYAPTDSPAGAVENMRQVGLIRPLDCVPSPPRRGAARCWPPAGLRGDQ